MENDKKLLSRNFLVLLQAQTVSRLGTQVYAVAMQLWIKQATGSASLMGILQMVASLPGVFLGPFGGAVADRYSRRKILYIADLIKGIVILTLTALVFLKPEAHNIIIAVLFIAAIIAAVLNTVFMPAMTASIPDIVSKQGVAAANSFNQLSVQLSLFFGQGLGGILFRLLGAPVLFLINGLSFIYACVTEFFIKIPQTLPERSADWREQFGHFKKDLIDGFKYIWSRTGLREAMAVSIFLGFFAAPIVTLLPFFVEDILKVRSDWYGFILAALSVGALLGYIFGGLRLPDRRRGNLTLACILLNAFCYIFVGLVRNPYLALLFAALAGFFSGFVSLSITTIVQIITPGEMRGRVFGLLGTMASALTPLAMGLAGIVADLLHHNIPVIYVACGLMMTILAVWVILQPNFQKMVRRELPPAPQTSDR